jgi:hypothetical protein
MNSSHNSPSDAKKAHNEHQQQQQQQHTGTGSGVISHHMVLAWKGYISESTHSNVANILVSDSTVKGELEARKDNRNTRNAPQVDVTAAFVDAPKPLKSRSAVYKAKNQSKNEKYNANRNKKRRENNALAREKAAKGDRDQLEKLRAQWCRYSRKHYLSKKAKTETETRSTPIEYIGKSNVHGGYTDDACVQLDIKGWTNEEHEHPNCWRNLTDTKVAGNSSDNPNRTHDDFEGNKENMKANLESCVTTTPVHSTVQDCSNAKKQAYEIIDICSSPECVDTPTPLQRKLVNTQSPLERIQQILHRIENWTEKALRCTDWQEYEKHANDCIEKITKKPTKLHQTQLDNVYIQIEKYRAQQPEMKVSTAVFLFPHTVIENINPNEFNICTDGIEVDQKIKDLVKVLKWKDSDGWLPDSTITFYGSLLAERDYARSLVDKTWKRSGIYPLDFINLLQRTTDPGNTDFDNVKSWRLKYIPGT